MKLRLKKHRWYKKILKTNDPLILSVGWRRFQTMPAYCIEDHNGRQRMIKYTPQHMHCIACCYGNVFHHASRVLICTLLLIFNNCLGPLVAPGIGFLGMQSVSGATVSCPNCAAYCCLMAVLEYLTPCNALHKCVLLLPMPAPYSVSFCSLTSESLPVVVSSKWTSPRRL